MSDPERALRIPRARLIFMALAALDQIVEQCHREPHRHSIALRVTLAMLYAFSDGRRAPYDRFWRLCAECNLPRDPQGSALRRGEMVGEAFHDICRTLNVRETSEFTGALRAAGRSPGDDMRGYRIAFGAMTEDDVLRMRMADIHRTQTHARNADLARARRGKECPIRD